MMGHFLRKINLIKDIVITLNISKIDFTKKFRENVDESNLEYDFFEVFQSSTNYYKGNILNNYFELKRRRSFFDSSDIFTKITGQLVEENDQLNIEVEVNGFKKRMLIFFVFMILLYLGLFLGEFLADKSNVSVIAVPFLLLHMFIMLGLPYIMIRRSVSKMAYNLERDFHYWVTKN